MRKFINFSLLSALLLAMYFPGYATPQDDYAALRALYLATDGDNWYDNTDWYDAAFFSANQTMPPGTDVSTWYGVVTDPGIGKVTALSLSFNNLIGFIPPEISLLSDITSLEMSQNQLMGDLPPDIGFLPNLQFLHLGNNQLTGQLPMEINNLYQLTSLQLSGNQFFGDLPPNMMNLTNLVDLYLDYNQFTGNIFPIFSMSNLQHVALSNNQFIGNIPPNIQNLQNLNHLDLSFNQISGNIPPIIGSLSFLSHLMLNDNQLSGDIPASLANLSNLQFMLLFNNQLTGCYDPALASLCGQLDPSYNNNAGVSDGNMLDATWEDFCNTGSCNAVFDLALTMNLSAGQAPVVAPGDMVSFDITISNQGSIDAFDVFVTNYLPAGYSFDPALNPGWFDINGDNYFEYLIVGPIPASTSYVTTLTLMVNNPFTGTPDDLVNFAEIINSADDNDPTTPPPADIDSTPDNDPFNDAGGTPNGAEDDYIDGDGTGMPLDGVAATDEDDHDPALVTMASILACVQRDYEALRALYLSTNGDTWTDNTGWHDAAFFTANATAPLGTDLSTWHGVSTDAGGCVTSLDLSNNNLTGFIAPEIGDLTDLTSLYLSYNQLSGDIPPSIGMLSNLITCWLSDNQLMGYIPAEIGMLSNLVELYLNSNQLMGSIPPELAMLTNLQFINLSNNQLTGCYDAALTALCMQLDPGFNDNGHISDGNMLDAAWEDFCASGMGDCSLPPPVFDLALTTTLSAGQAPDVLPGDIVSFDITVINQGDTDAYNILVTDYVPAGYVFDPAMNPGWFDMDADGNPDYMEVGPLQPSVAVTFPIILIVNSPFTGTPDDLVNYAEIVEADNDTDPTNMPPMDVDSSPDNVSFNDAGGTPNGPDDDYTDGDGTGMPLDGVAATDEDDHDPTLVNLIITSPCIADDYEALRALYLSTNGDFWANRTGWPDAAYFIANPTAPPFTDFNGWFGIDVDAATGCVMNVLLGGNGLDGFIPPEIGLLSNVFHINLKFNNLMGDIPPDIGNLTDLVILELSFNQLTGQLPPDLANMSALQFLELQSNQLFGCYDPALNMLCGQLNPLTNTNQYISDGNFFLSLIHI